MTFFGGTNSICIRLTARVQILFFEDPVPVRELAAKFPAYADKFPQWSEHTSGMHQYICKCSPSDD